MAVNGYVSGYTRNGGDMDAWRRESANAAREPFVGDRYQDHYSWWIYVMRVTSDEVSWLSGLSFPHDAKVHDASLDEFAEWIARQGVLLESRDEDVAGWYECTHGGCQHHE